MKNKFKQVGEHIYILFCPNPINAELSDSEVTIDKETFDKISNVDALWEVCWNPFESEEGEPLTIGAIIHKQFVDLKRVILGLQEIPTNEDDVIKSMTTEDYIQYLNILGAIVREDEKGFLYPLSHEIAGADWDEGVIFINGNKTDQREINLLKVKIEGLTPYMHLSYIDYAEQELVYKVKR